MPVFMDRLRTAGCLASRKFESSMTCDLCDSSTGNIDPQRRNRTASQISEKAVSELSLPKSGKTIWRGLRRALELRVKLAEESRAETQRLQTIARFRGKRGTIGETK